MRFLIIFFLLLATVPRSGHSQNVEAIPDRPVPLTSERGSPAIRGTHAEAEVAQPAGSEVLIPSLESIVVEEINSTGSGGTTILTIRNGSFAPQNSIEEELSAWLGEPLTFDEIANLRIALADTWDRVHGEVVRVAVPPQDITDGVLTLQIIRAKLGKLSVEGAKFFDTTDYTDAFRVMPGSVVDMDTIVSDIDWLERNPYRNVGVVLEQGSAFGETDVVLNVQDQRPWQVFAGYDREGSDLLGVDRLFFGGNHGNVFGKGHRAVYQYFTDVEFKNSHGHFASYLIPLPWRHEFQFSGFYSESSVATDSGIAVPGLETILNAGESWQVGLDYIIPLPRVKRFPKLLGNAEQDLVFGFDAKSSDSNLDFGELTVFATATETYHFRGEWRARRYDRFGAVAMRAKLVASPGDWSGHNSDAAYQASRAGADSSYAYGEFEFDRQTNLPGGFTFLTTAAFHDSSTNQLASEQLVLSGDGAVRGFERSRVRADRGMLVSAQLNAPAINIGKVCELPAFAKPFAFVDYGMGRSIDRLPGEPDHVHLTGTGLGVKMELGKRVSGNIQYGWQVGESGFDDGENGRLHVGITTTW